jgi:phosphatidylcholine synthase
MPDPDDSASAGRLRRVSRAEKGLKLIVVAWAVHVLTASGAVLALFAAIAALAHDWQTTFLLLGIALVVDAVDGPLARAFHVRARLPTMEGATLDLVVDFATYVLVPAIVLAEGPLLPAPYGALAAAVVAVVGALYFGDTRMKTAHAAFRGFPAVWNAVVFALMVFGPPAPVTLAVVALLAVLSFSPIEFVHPVRVRRWRGLTLAVTALWAALAILALFTGLSLPLPAAVAFAAATLYLALVGAVQQRLR